MEVKGPVKKLKTEELVFYFVTRNFGTILPFQGKNTLILLQKCEKDNNFHWILFNDSSFTNKKKLQLQKKRYALQKG